jgi:hypothetical protein
MPGNDSVIDFENPNVLCTEDGNYITVANSYYFNGKMDIQECTSVLADVANQGNHRLQTLLARRFPVILCSEYGTSKHPSCCHERATGVRTLGYTRRSTVIQCDKCKTLLSRDGSAAALIGNIFQFQRTRATGTLPTWTEFPSSL